MLFCRPAGDHPVMTTHPQTIVWIDHQVAKVLHFNADSSEMVLIQSTHPHQHLHHKANSSDSGHAPTDKKFHERVGEAIAGSEAILIVGPASAKMELVAHLKHSRPAVAGRVSAVEAMDHPTDGQLLAHGRRFFVA
jgi:stalled ribosome rescue protein Dom34